METTLGFPTFYHRRDRFAMILKNIITFMIIMFLACSLDWEWSNIKSFVSGVVLATYVIKKYFE